MRRVQDHGESSANSKSGPTFDPPVYRQRYQKVREIIDKYKAKKVVDFGCAEAKMLRFLINGESAIEELVGVDIDGDLLKDSVFRIRPLTSDYLIPRPAPLTVSLYQGSISEADDRFCDFDVVACVEIVEHLIPEHLEAMPTALLGQLSPKVAIVTTPNVEFNVLFPDLVGFRHWDHKFEWTRAEFEQWAKIQAEKFGYSVTFEGIGPGPLDTDHLGCCSQMALFIKDNANKNHDDNDDSNDDIKNDDEEEDKQKFGHPYNLIAEVQHPYRKCTLTEEEKILQEVTRLLWFLSQPTDYYDEETEYDDTGQDDCPTSFTLDILFAMPSLKKLCGSVERLRAVIQESKLELTEDGNSVLHACQSEWSSEGSDSDTGWDIENTTDAYCTSSEIPNTEPTPYEDWDVDDDAVCNNVGDENVDKETLDSLACWTSDLKIWNGIESWTEECVNTKDTEPFGIGDVTTNDSNHMTLCDDKALNDDSDNNDDDDEFRPSVLHGWQMSEPAYDDGYDDAVVLDDGDDDNKDWDCVTGEEGDGMVWIVPDNVVENGQPES